MKPIMARSIALGMVCAATIWLSGCGHDNTLLSTSVPKQPPTHDGRFDTKCNARVGGIPAHVNACWIGFAQLAGDLRKYSGQVVILTGYLTRENGQYNLYSDDNASKHFDAASSIYVQDFADEYFKEHPGLIVPLWVRIAGTFDATSEGSDHVRLGSIHDLLLFTPM
jgi:hypothetical protein